MFTNRFHPVKPHLVRKGKIIMCKCPQCGGVSPDVENADWVVDGVPFCQMSCYDKAIQEILEEMHKNGTLNQWAEMSFHLG